MPKKLIGYITCVYIQKQPSVVAIKAVEILKIIKYMKMYALLPSCLLYTSDAADD